MKVRKGVFPTAGLCTRFLPATKAQPKEMLPLVDKPTMQYAVEEAVASGLSEMIIVTGRGKRAIADHFDAAFELEYYLNDRGKLEELGQISKRGRRSVDLIPPFCQNFSNVGPAGGFPGRPAKGLRTR